MSRAQVLAVIAAAAAIGFTVIGSLWSPRAGSGQGSDAGSSGAPVAADAADCPMVTGQITAGRSGPGLRLPITLRLAGAGASEQLTAQIDTGAEVTSLPDSLLRRLGFAPVDVAVATGIGGRQGAYVYEIPYPQVRDSRGRWVPIGQGTLPVLGLPGNSQLALLGADILRHVSLSVAQGSWTLRLPCLPAP